MGGPLVVEGGSLRASNKTHFQRQPAPPSTLSQRTRKGWGTLISVRTKRNHSDRMGHPPRPSFGVQHNGDFAVGLDGDGQVRGLVVVEVADCQGKAAVELGDRAADGDRWIEGAVALAVEQRGIAVLAGGGDVEFAVEVEVGHHHRLWAAIAGRADQIQIDRAKRAIAVIEQNAYAAELQSGHYEVLPAVVAQVG